MEFGILTNGVSGIRKIDLKHLQPALPTANEIQKKYIKGITTDRLIVIDGEILLNDKNIIVHEEVTY